MDETYHLMQIFYQTLHSFNLHLWNSFRDLSNQHNQVDPLWQDNFRKTYDAQWQAFEDKMVRYINAEAPNYDQFLFDKMHELRRYLEG